MSKFSVVFDMDGVLFDTETVALKSWITVGERHGYTGIEPVAFNCIGRSTKDTIAIFQSAYPDADIPSLLVECVDEFKRIISAEGLTLKTGVRELLEWLKANGIKTAVASSTNKHGVLSNLRMSGLDGYFSVVFGGDTVENSKPDPEIYQKACAALDEPPQSCFAVEDSNNGIISASRAGMRPILVPDIVENTDEVKALAEKQFKDLLEVRDYFEKELQR